LRGCRCHFQTKSPRLVASTAPSTMNRAKMARDPRAVSGVSSCSRTIRRSSSSTVMLAGLQPRRASAKIWSRCGAAPMSTRSRMC
jgi:hypothetical protein